MPGEDQQVDLKNFFKCFENEINSFADLFRHINRNDLNFGSKKINAFSHHSGHLYRNDKQKIT